MRVAALFLLFFLPVLAARWFLQNQGYETAFSAYFADLIWSALLALLLVRSGRWALAPVLLVWLALHYGNAGFIAAMGESVDYRDLAYLLDPAFLRATLGENLLGLAITAAAALAGDVSNTGEDSGGAGCISSTGHCRLASVSAGWNQRLGQYGLRKSASG